MSLESQSATIRDEDGLSVVINTGSAEPASAVVMGGSDSTNVQAILTDTSGRQIAVGAAADGAAVAGNPVLIGGSDGTNAQNVLVDTSGRPRIVGAAADGAAVAGDPVLIGGSDGTNAQNILVDTSGRLQMVGAAADGVAAAGNPVLIAGADGSGDVQTLLTDTAGRLEVNTTGSDSTTSTLTNVAASATNVTLLAANTDRTGAIIVNDGNKNLYIKFGATASTTSFTAKIPSNGYYEVPFSYTGIIDGIWDSANGSARITELEA